MNESIMSLKERLSPADFSDYLRKQGKIFFAEKAQAYVVTDYKLAVAFLKDPRLSCDRSAFFISRMPSVDLSLLPDFFKVVSQLMVMSDAKSHQNRRRVCYQGFSNHIVNGLLHTLEEKIQHIVCSLKPGMDLVKHFTTPIPIHLLADFFCIPEQDRAYFVDHAKCMTAFFGGAAEYDNNSAIAVNNAASHLSEYFRGMIIDREHRPQDDFVGLLVQHRHQFGLTIDEIISQAIMMWVAGMVTTTDQLGNNLYAYMKLAPSLRNDVDPFHLIEEFNRLDPAVTFITRVTTETVSTPDGQIPAGAPVFIATHCVNRDPDIFTMPDDLKPGRRKKILSHGFGAHYCMGAQLSNKAMAMALSALRQTFPQMKLGVSRRDHYSISFSGFKQLVFR